MRILLPLSLLALFALSPTPSVAEEELKPLADYNRMTKELRRVPRDERVAEAKKRSLEYLAKWKAAGGTATGSALYAIAQFQQDAEQFKAAAESYRAVRKGKEAKTKTQDFAATAEAGLLTFAALRNDVGLPAIDEATKDLVAYAEGMTDNARKKSQGKLRGVLAILHTMAGRHKASRTLRLKIVADDVKALGKQVRPIMRGLLGQTHKKDAYDAIRAEAESVLASLTKAQSGVTSAAKGKLDAARTKLLAKAPAALNEDGSLKQTDRKKMGREERAYSSAKRNYDRASELLESLPAYGEPFGLLGKKAKPWTLENAFTEDVFALTDLKDKVVLLDFWNTWGAKCSFPVLRDLRAQYGEKGLAIVGVTASSNMVFFSRFDFDADHQSKVKGPKQYAARIATEREPANGDYILEEEAYRKREIEVIGEFIKNHELPWPNVLIDKTDPATKFAQDTWPHTVLLDKQGHIRFIRGGALERDRKAVVAHLKKVIEDLLAE